MKLKQRGVSDKELEAKAQLLPGITLYGYCGGLFGRDSYGDKIIVAVYEDRIVAKEDGHTLVSRTIDGNSYTWSGIIEDSNRVLEEQKADEEYCRNKWK